MNTVDSISLRFDTKGDNARTIQAVQDGHNVGTPKLILTRLRDGLRLGKMRDAIRNGIGYPRHHVANTNIRHKIAKQKGILVANRARERAIARQHLLSLGNMDVPTWHERTP